MKAGDDGAVRDRPAWYAITVRDDGDALREDFGSCKTRLSPLVTSSIGSEAKAALAKRYGLDHAIVYKPADIAQPVRDLASDHASTSSMTASAATRCGAASTAHAHSARSSASARRSPHPGNRCR
jgi:hypothetical protein